MLPANLFRHPNAPRKPMGMSPPADIQGGVPLQRMPVIDWKAIGSIPVFVDGKVKAARFEPAKEVGSIAEIIHLLVLMLSSKPGPVRWESIPIGVRQHFKVVDSGPKEDTSSEQA